MDGMGSMRSPKKTPWWTSVTTNPSPLHARSLERVQGIAPDQAGAVRWSYTFSETNVFAPENRYPKRKCHLPTIDFQNELLVLGSVLVVLKNIISSNWVHLPHFRYLWIQHDVREFSTAKNSAILPLYLHVSATILFYACLPPHFSSMICASVHQLLILRMVIPLNRYIN